MCLKDLKSKHHLSDFKKTTTPHQNFTVQLNNFSQQPKDIFNRVSQLLLFNSWISAYLGGSSEGLGSDCKYVNICPESPTERLANASSNSKAMNQDSGGGGGTQMFNIYTHISRWVLWMFLKYFSTSILTGSEWVVLKYFSTSFIHWLLWNIPINICNWSNVEDSGEFL